MSAYKVKDEAILPLLLAGHSQQQVADMLGVTKTTISKRVHRPEFAETLAQYRQSIIDSVVTRMTALSGKAVDTLEELLEDDNSFVRFNAASKILSMSQDYSLQHDLIQKVEELRQRQEDLEDNASVTMDYD